MARILGLDLGSHSVKAVLLESTMRGYSVKAVVSAPVPTDGERSARMKAALQALQEKGPLLADSVVVAVPGLSMATHSLSLPFADPKKIDATLGFEVEGQLPFDLTEAVYDYQISTADDKGANLVVGVVRKEDLGALLEPLKELKLDPRIVTHPALTAQSLMGVLPTSLLPESPEDATAFVDLGHERVNVSIGRLGGIELARTFAGGGQALTKALAAEFKIGLPEAQGWKEEHGAVGPEAVGADAERAAGAFLRALQPVLRELKTTIKAYTAKTRRHVGRIVLYGGTSKLRGVPEQLERDLGISTRRLELPQDLRDVAGATSGAELAQAWGLALRGNATGAKAPRFNLRKGDFGFKSDFDFVRERIGQLVAFGIVLFALLIASGIVRNTILERREKQTQAQLCDITQRILGKCEKNFETALSMLKGKDSTTASIPKRSAATLLAELTQKLPADIPVTLDQVVVDLDRIGVRCETGTSKQIEDIIAALKTAKCFKEVKEGKVEKNKDGTKVSFRLDIQVECPEDAAAPQG